MTPFSRASPSHSPGAGLTPHGLVPSPLSPSTFTGIDTMTTDSFHAVAHDDMPESPLSHEVSDTFSTATLFVEDPNAISTPSNNSSLASSSSTSLPSKPSSLSSPHHTTTTHINNEMSPNHNQLDATITHACSDSDTIHDTDAIIATTDGDLENAIYPATPHYNTTGKADSLKSTKYPVVPNDIVAVEDFIPTKITYPEGGWAAWSVVLGSVLIFFSSFGWCNTFGVFQTYYINSGFLPQSRSQVSWIGSLQMWGAFFGAGIAGSLFDAFGAKPIIIPASIILVIGVMMQSLCTQYYQLLLAQGLMQGLAIGFLFTPSAAAVTHWFSKRRGLASGIVVAGASLGGVFWPILLNHLLNRTTIGFAWSLRICGFISLALLIPGCFLVVGRLPRKTNFHPWALSAFTNKVTLTYLAGCFFVFWGCFIPYTYLGLRSKNHGMRTDLTFYITSVLNAGSLVGRIVPGFLGDYYGRFNVYIVCSTFMGILALLWMTTAKPWEDLLFAAAFGAASGSCVSLSGPCAAHLAPHPSEIGTYMGTMFLMISIASLTGSPIAGQIVSAQDGSYTGAIVFAGVSILLGAALLAGCRYLQQPKLLKRF